MNKQASQVAPAASQRARVLSTAVADAANRLGLRSTELGSILGTSQPCASRLLNGKFFIAEGSKTWELAAHLVRLYRSLSSLAGGNDELARAWLKSGNRASRRPAAARPGQTHRWSAPSLRLPWTATALSSEARPWQGAGWRAVEALHKVATMALVRGDLGDQALLEDILEEAKPHLPREAAGLHWLLATPFRYWPRPPAGSRFRATDQPGVFYGADEEATACAECGYWRLRFWQDSSGLAEHEAAIPITLFQFHGATAQALDLTRPPLNAGQTSWTHPSDYTATQQLAAQARQANIELIRYPIRSPPSRHLPCHPHTARIQGRG